MKKHVHGGNIYAYENCLDFSANCNPLGTPQSVKAAVVESLEHIADYPQVGYAPLRGAIASYECVAPEQVICGNGAAELIFSLCRAKKPKKALVASPTFAEYEQALESVDCEVRHVGLNHGDFAVGQEFIDALDKDLDMAFLCNPNNPTGILMERDYLFHVLRVCRDMDILLAVDECFLDFVKDPMAYTLKAQLERYENLFILKAFTKRYAMAGIRLGYGLTGNRPLLEAMELATQPWNISVMAQAAGLAALKETEYVEQGRQMVFEQSEYLKAEMEAMGLRVYPSQANYIFFCGPSDFFESCVKKGILIRDCSNYVGLSEGYYRIAVRTGEENRKLIRVFKEILGSAQEG